MTVTELFQGQGLTPLGPVTWGETIPCDQAGVYTVALDPDPASSEVVTCQAKLSREVLRYWLPTEAIVYIGKAGGPGLKSTVGSRVRQFVRHRHGARSPHRGGQDVKLLAPLPLWVFWATVSDPRLVEKRMLAAFVAAVGQRPFANCSD